MSNDSASIISLVISGTNNVVLETGFNITRGLSFDTFENLYVSNAGTNTISVVTSQATLTTASSFVINTVSAPTITSPTSGSVTSGSVVFVGTGTSGSIISIYNTL